MRSSKLVHFSVLKPSLSTSALWIWGQRAATLPARVCNGNPATLSPWQSIRDQKTQRRPLIYTSPLIIQEVKLINWDLDASDKVRKISVAPQHLLCIFLPLNKAILHLPIISAPGLIWSCDRFAGITHVLRKRGMKEDEAQAVVATCAFISSLCLFVQLWEKEEKWQRKKKCISLQRMVPQRSWQQLVPYQALLGQKHPSGPWYGYLNTVTSVPVGSCARSCGSGGLWAAGDAWSSHSLVGRTGSWKPLRVRNSAGGGEWYSSLCLQTCGSRSKNNQKGTFVFVSHSLWRIYFLVFS